MANYNLIVDSTFQPFSFERYIKPYQIYEESYREVEDALGELATQAGVWENLANEQTDEKAYKQYKKYSNDLKNQAEQLAKYGLSNSSRRDLLKLKSRYSSEIIPIEQAYKKRAEDIKVQQAAKKDPTVKFDIDAATTSLDTYLDNPTIDTISNNYSGTMLYNQVYNAAKEFKQVLRRGNLQDLGLPKQYERMLQYGHTVDEVFEAMYNDPKASPILHRIVDNVMESSGIRNWSSMGENYEENPVYQELKGHALRGLVGAIGTSKYEHFKDTESADPSDNGDGSSLYYRPVPRTTIDPEVKTSQLNADRKFLNQVLQNPDILNKEESRATSKGGGSSNNAKYGDTPLTQPLTSEMYYPNIERLEEIAKRYGGIDIDIKDGSVDKSNIPDIIEKINNKIKSSATRDFSYVLNITESDLAAKTIKENALTLNRNSGNTGLYELDDNSKGDSIGAADLGTYLNKDSSLEFDPDLGIIINSGEKSAILDIELIDTPARTFRNALAGINKSLQEGEEEAANLLIDRLMTALYLKFNTLAKKQSNTDSNI